MTLQAILKERVAKQGLENISKEMGYENTEHFANRLEAITSSPYLGLESGTYDFHMSTRKFLGKLVALIGLPKALLDEVMREVEACLEKERDGFQQHFFIDTGFKRSTENVIALGGAERLRRPRLPTELVSDSLNEQLADVQAFVRQHYHDNPELPVWGRPKTYIYHFKPGFIINLDVNGEVLDAKKEAVE